MGTKNNPGVFDCYANADPDEPMFVLLGRDPMAGALVRAWADTREEWDEDPGKVNEARSCADAMDSWAEKLGKTRIAIGTHGDRAMRLARELDRERDRLKELHGALTGTQSSLDKAIEALEVEKEAHRYTTQSRDRAEADCKTLRHDADELRASRDERRAEWLRALANQSVQEQKELVTEYEKDKK